MKRLIIFSLLIVPVICYSIQKQSIHARLVADRLYKVEIGTVNLIAFPDDVIIVAGHGPNFSVNQLKDYRNMVLETLSIIEEAMAQGLSLEEIKQRNVLKNYEKWEKGYFSCDDWIEIVYNSLTYDNN